MELKDAIKLRLFELLSQKNYKSLGDLFKLSGVPRSTINSLWGSTKCKLPHLDTLLHLCEGLSITLKDFFNDEIFENVTDTSEDSRDF